MKEIIKYAGLLIILLAVMASCSQNHDADDIVNGPFSIRSISVDGKTREKFLYNHTGKIVEYQSFSFCQKYSYDGNGFLIKQEIAADPYLASSSYHPEKSELMTSDNSSFNANYYYQYDNDGRLITQKNYYKKSNLFEYTSKVSMVYEGNRIVQWNLHNAGDTITQFYAYEYDIHGNVTKQKYYSYLYTTEPKPKLISEVTYKYDDKNNPFIIYKDLGQPGLYTNPNNVVETNSVLFETVPGIPQTSTSKTTYEYNQKGYPVKVNGSVQYNYE